MSPSNHTIFVDMNDVNVIKIDSNFLNGLHLMIIQFSFSFKRGPFIMIKMNHNPYCQLYPNLYFYPFSKYFYL